MYSTTMRRIAALYDAERLLLDLGARDELTDAERAIASDIRAELAKLWPQERAERVFARDGLPRIISAPDPRSQRQVARGIQPLPQIGGE